ncbi:MAG: ABC transporter ATP-binding protein, partial [Pannonibacter phragmitetus]
MTQPAPQEDAAFISLQGLEKSYPAGGSTLPVFSGLNLTFPRGDFAAIMGPSGSGKSTLMHCMAGLDKATSGDAYIGGHNLSALPEKQVTRIRRDKVGFVFQSFNLLPTLTAAQNIALPLELAGRRVERQHF